MRKMAVVFVVCMVIVIGCTINKVTNSNTIIDDNNIAIVNEDQSRIYNDEELKISDYFITQILNNEKYDFSIVSKSKADTGMENNAYSMEIVFPSSFTQNVVSISNQMPNKVQIEYLYNTNLSKEQLLSLQSDEDLLSFYLNSSLNYIYTYGIIEGLNKAKNYSTSIVENGEENISYFDDILSYDLLADKSYEITPFDNGGMELDQFDTSQVHNLDVSEQAAQANDLLGEYTSDVNEIVTDYQATENMKNTDIAEQFNYISDELEVESTTIELLRNYLFERS